METHHKLVGRLIEQFKAPEQTLSAFQIASYRDASSALQNCLNGLVTQAIRDDSVDSIRDLERHLNDMHAGYKQCAASKGLNAVALGKHLSDAIRQARRQAEQCASSLAEANRGLHENVQLEIGLAAITDPRVFNAYGARLPIQEIAQPIEEVRAQVGSEREPSADANPVEGLRGYIHAWRRALDVYEKINGTGDSAVTSRRIWTNMFASRVPAANIEAFRTLLDTTEDYIDRVLVPKYQPGSEDFNAVNRHWQLRHLVLFQPPTPPQALDSTPCQYKLLKELCADRNTIRVTTNSMNVARTFIEDWLTHTRVGADTDLYGAVMRDASNFKQLVHGNEHSAP